METRDILLPCPFCGSTDIGGASGIVSCYGCDIETGKFQTTEEAVAAWNLRTQAANLPEQEPVAYMIWAPFSGPAQFTTDKSAPVKTAQRADYTCTPLYTSTTDFRDAYVGAREDLEDWKRRALSAEENNRQLTRALGEQVNGQTFMGEPAIKAQTRQQASAPAEQRATRPADTLQGPPGVMTDAPGFVVTPVEQPSQNLDALVTRCLDDKTDYVEWWQDALAAITDLRRQLAEAKENELDYRKNHATLARGIKRALSLDTWPDLEGTFAESVVAMLNNFVGAQAATITRLESEKREMRGLLARANELLDCIGCSPEGVNQDIANAEALQRDISSSLERTK